MVLVNASAAAPAAVANGQSGDAIKRIPLPRATAESTRELWVASTKPKLFTSVLVFFSDDQPAIRTLLADPVWLDYASLQHLDLAAVVTTVSGTPNADGTLTVGPAIGANIQSALNGEFGSQPTLLLYTLPHQAAVAESVFTANSKRFVEQAAVEESVLTANPKRVLGWCLLAPDRLRDAGNAMPPGIVVCQKENKPVHDALLGDFTQMRKRGERLTWIALPGDHYSNSQFSALDAFVRDYFAALASIKFRADTWQNIDTKAPVSVADLNAHPGSASYLPNALLLPAWAALHVPGGSTLAQQSIVEQEVDTFNPAQPKLHLYLRKPASAVASGKILGVLAYCTWNDQRDKILRGLLDPQNRLVRYAEDHHLALLTWSVGDAFNNNKNADELSRQTNFADDLSFEKVAVAWETSVHTMCLKEGLPERDFLLYGISRGAQWAHRLALRKPGHFLAVHIHVSSTYDLPTPAAKNILWLQTTGEQDYGYESALRFYAKCRQLGYPIMFKAGENLGHDSSLQTEELGRRFFDYALSVKAKRDELIARASQVSFNRPIQPDLYALSGLGQAPYFADLINQEVYVSDQRDMVPVEQRVPLPTRALAQAWGGIVDSHDLIPVSNSPSFGTPKAPGTVIEDDADQNAYRNGWNEASGGTGFGEWKFQAHHDANNSFAGHFLADDSANPAKTSIEASIASNGKAFGLYANGSGFETSAAFRSLLVPLKAGDTFSCQMVSVVIEQKGAADNSGSGKVGLTLRHGCAAQSTTDYDREARFEIVNVKGLPDYQVYDGEANHDTGVARADQGVTVAVTLTSADTYDLKITRLADQVTTVLKGRRLGPGGPIESFCLFSRNGESADGLFNNFQVVADAK